MTSTKMPTTGQADSHARGTARTAPVKLTARAWRVLHRAATVLRGCSAEVSPDEVSAARGMHGVLGTFYEAEPAEHFAAGFAINAAGRARHALGRDGKGAP